MDNKYLNEVLDRLENYQKMMRQIELLQYEIQYASHVTPTVQISPERCEDFVSDGVSISV